MRFRIRSIAWCVFVVGALAGGCASTKIPSCELTPAETQQVQSNIYAFLPKEMPGVDVRCEEITESTEHLRGHGCAIHGGPRGGSACPTTLDGGYLVVFNRATLKPKRIVLLVW
jgi:hypothetical protein